MGDGAWMQAVAREMNLSETAFVAPRPDGSYDLRWFTPLVEVDLCGHATLAAAHVLFEQKLIPGNSIGFHTLSGLLTARQEGRWLELDFPSQPPRSCQLEQEVIAALEVEPPLHR
jgi:PhzF family phenazine biosynthesis protein